MPPLSHTHTDANSLSASQTLLPAGQLILTQSQILITGCAALSVLSETVFIVFGFGFRTKTKISSAAKGAPGSLDIFFGSRRTSFRSHFPRFEQKFK